MHPNNLQINKILSN